MTLVKFLETTDVKKLSRPISAKNKEGTYH